jgi:hypothetical protein
VGLEHGGDEKSRGKLRILEIIQPFTNLVVWVYSSSKQYKTRTMMLDNKIHFLR